MTTYPHKCSRCGFCCIAATCPIALEKMEGTAHDAPCPALDIGIRDEASCALFAAFCKERPDLRTEIEDVFGVNKGCCIKAMVISLSSRMSQDFAGMTAKEKREEAVKLYGRRVGEYYKPEIELHKREIEEDVPFADPDGLLDIEEINDHNEESEG